jgi:3',5'-cyclic AMP phosphodiesterase CpdA
VPALAASTDTTVRTIQDTDGDNLLEPAPGEDYCVFRPASATSPEGFDCDGEPLHGESPRSIVTFAQLTDFQMVDEESPARAEWLDFTQRGLFNPFSAAYRPQESLTTQVTEAMVRQMRNWVSRVSRQKAEFTILTGDNADNQQLNETRWFVDILDGTTGARPEPFSDQVNPNSGVPVTGCEATPGSVYDGVRDHGRHRMQDDGYYEPDSSAEPRHDGDGYTPSRSENAQDIGRDVTVRDFPNLFEAANDPFEALGAEMPWYSAFGNHDALVQGNQPFAYTGPFGPVEGPANAAYQAVATGCVKVTQPSAATDVAIGNLQQEIEDLKGPDGELTFEDLEQAIANAGQIDEKIRDELIEACGNADCTEPNPGFAGSVDIVPPDPKRCFLAKDRFAGGGAPSPDPATPPCEHSSWIDQHFATTGAPVGHGFAPAPSLTPAQQLQCELTPTAPECVEASYGRPASAITNHDGYYSFAPKPRLRFVVLDTVTDECGSGFCSEGSVDDLQYQWLEEQIRLAKQLGEYVMVFSHHTLRTTRQPDPSDPTEDPIHYGERADERTPPQPQNPLNQNTLEDLYCSYDNVLANVAGHEHENYVLHHHCEDAPGANDFWEVSTAAHIDWPQQMRMVELVNYQGELTLALTILDHAGPPNPGGARPCTEEPPPAEPPFPEDPRCEVALGRSGEDPVKLASIGREISYNDYQGSRGARGARSDRNVIIPLDRPAP